MVRVENVSVSGAIFNLSKVTPLHIFSFYACNPRLRTLRYLFSWLRPLTNSLMFVMDEHADQSQIAE